MVHFGFILSLLQIFKYANFLVKIIILRCTIRFDLIWFDLIWFDLFRILLIHIRSDDL
jgi:hypothetical protein